MVQFTITKGLMFVTLISQHLFDCIESLLYQRVELVKSYLIVALVYMFFYEQPLSKESTCKKAKKYEEFVLLKTKS